MGGPLSYLLSGYPAMGTSAARMSSSSVGTKRTKQAGTVRPETQSSATPCISPILNPTASNKTSNVVSNESTLSNVVKEFLGDPDCTRLMSLYGPKMSNKILDSESFSSISQHKKDEVKSE